jgi:hypothetical protein
MTYHNQPHGRPEIISVEELHALVALDRDWCSTPSVSASGGSTVGSSRCSDAVAARSDSPGLVSGRAVPDPQPGTRGSWAT